ncbi:hypothetical protein GDO78_011799, partial [Eleutherodactylus coqui]
MTMETQEEMALPEETADVLQNSNNLSGGEDKKTSITESRAPGCSNDIVHSVSEKGQDVSRGDPANPNVEVLLLPRATEVSEGTLPTIVIESLPCNLQPQENMEVAEQLEGLHFKNHTIDEHDEGLGGTDCVLVNDCLPASIRIEAAGVYDHEESSSEDSSSDSDSDSDSSSSSSTSSSSSSLSSVLQLDEEPPETIDLPMKTRDELLVDELPTVEELSISLPDHVELKPFGTVSSIIEQLVIIESFRDTLPLNEDTIVFKEDRSAVGKIF